MNIILPGWAVALGLMACFTGGVGLGTAYFRCLLWSAGRFAAGGRVSVTAGLLLGRFVLLGGALMLASQLGALPMLATALGVLVGRFVVMRRVGAIA